MSSKSLQLLSRFFMFKYAATPVTLRSNELLGTTTAPPPSIELTSQDFEEYPPSTERRVPQNRFEDDTGIPTPRVDNTVNNNYEDKYEDDEESPMPRIYDESKFTPKQQKLFYVIDKLRMNDLCTQPYRDQMAAMIADSNDSSINNAAKELKNYIKDLSNRQDYFQEKINFLKSYINSVLLDK